MNSRRVEQHLSGRGDHSGRSRSRLCSRTGTSDLNKRGPDCRSTYKHWGSGWGGEGRGREEQTHRLVATAGLVMLHHPRCLSRNARPSLPSPNTLAPLLLLLLLLLHSTLTHDLVQPAAFTSAASCCRCPPQLPTESKQPAANDSKAGRSVGALNAAQACPL